MKTEPKTAVGVFPDLSHAEYAVEELRRNGFGADQIGFLVSDATRGVEPPTVDPGTKAGEGATVGTVAGVTLGALLGAALATVALPGVGLVIAGGLLAGVFGGAVLGGTGGSILGALIGLEIPEEEARHYEREFHSGRTLVTVRADGRYEEAIAILRRAQEHEPPNAAPGRGRLSEMAEAGAADVGGSVVPRP
jgi:hypothetical protein